MPSKYDVTSFYALLSQNAHNAEVVGFPVPCHKSFHEMKGDVGMAS